MKISYNWLKRYIRLDLSPGQVAELLTDCGLEVEATENWCSVRGGMEGVVIGEIIECMPHPDSDHLSLTHVSIGKPETLPIVCGAPNVAVGQKVAVATVGTTLFLKDQEIVIRKAKIRGEVSEGMICAEDELGLGPSHDGILVLDPSAISGTPAAEYFQVELDVVFHIGLTPNRSDAASHIGVARDLVAVLNNKGGKPFLPHPVSLLLPDVTEFSPDPSVSGVKVIVENSQACPRYSGLTLANVQVTTSPEWMQNLLKAVGLRPINNIVDVTNFVLMELGQPLHAFDADKVNNHLIRVKTYPDETPFVTLDGLERKLSAGDLMISSDSNPLCIAGVFGGADSGVTSTTTNVFLESACFDPVWVRKTARSHGLQTDASFRFERGTDINVTVYALKRAALLIREIAGGEIAGEIEDVYPIPVDATVIRLDFRYLDNLIGQQIPGNVVTSILKDLGFGVEKSGNEGLLVQVPTYKVEVTREADVAEEILRIYGYNNIRIPGQVRSTLSYRPDPDPDRVRRMIRALLTSNGFFEIINNSLTRSGYYTDNQIFPIESCVRILNPISRDLDVMRQTLLFGGLETIQHNQNRKAYDLKLFETGTVYRIAAPEDTRLPLAGYREQQRLALFMTGVDGSENWREKPVPTDLFVLKGYIEALLSRLSIDPHNYTIEPFSSPVFSSGMAYRMNGTLIITAGSVNPDILGRFDLKQSVYFADIELDQLMVRMPTTEIRYRELPKFPVVRRDLALLIDRQITFEQIRQVALGTEQKLLKEVGLFDVYEGEHVEPGKKSYAVSFLLGDEAKTLTENEIEKTMASLVQAFGRHLGAKIR